MGVALIGLIVYLATVIVAVAALRRNIGESMLIGFVVLCLFGGTSAPSLAWSSLVETALNPLIFSVTAFVFMGILFQVTGTINRMVAILNSVLGRLPGGAGYVSTVASGLFGSISHGGSANAAAIGSVTVPWMKRSGWPSHVAATLVAGNSGIGHVIPPSPSLLLLLGMSSVAPFVSLDDVALPLVVAAGWVMLYRLLIVYFFVRRNGITGLDTASLEPFGQAFRRGWATFLIFLGIAIPLVLTTGPAAEALTGYIGAAALESIEIILWIPILMMVISALLGLRSLPRRPREVYHLFERTAPQFLSVGATVVFAFAASEVLATLGLGAELGALLSGFRAQPLVLLLIIGVVIIVVAGPLPAAATTATIGGVSFTVLTQAGIEPAPAIAALLIFASTEGASPPSGAPIYIASGQAGTDPVRTFVPLVSLYVVPFLALGVLVGGGLLPITF
ncbi:TRAP transporter large permease subunit [Prauserella cavernicola]|uniref:TRAP transporter large permease subunit n=1 Tax=Prauserella cavernicola TaxID=2800127 RepID=A0A934QRY9_9PSEU|nr:TRAP transporter large permease subunit [Prauserella cavernicola]MBK1787132.1 TRAP transporter large permease subunit [Prauserella cavernicola]